MKCCENSVLGECSFANIKAQVVVLHGGLPLYQDRCIL